MPLCIRCMLCHVCFHQVLHQILCFMIIIILATHILLYHSYSIPPVSCSYLIIPWVLSTWYHLFYIYLLLHAYAHDTVFNVWLWFSFIDTRVLIFARHLAFASPLAWEFYLTPLDPNVQVLERVDPPSCWSEWRRWRVDHWQIVRCLILPAPLRVSRVFLL